MYKLTTVNIVKAPRLVREKRRRAGGGGLRVMRKRRDGERKLRSMNSFNMPIPSLINISFILNIGWKYFYIKEKEDLFYGFER